MTNFHLSFLLPDTDFLRSCLFFQHFMSNQFCSQPLIKFKNTSGKPSIPQHRDLRFSWMQRHVQYNFLLRKLTNCIIKPLKLKTDFKQNVFFSARVQISEIEDQDCSKEASLRNYLETFHELSKQSSWFIIPNFPKQVKFIPGKVTNKIFACWWKQIIHATLSLSGKQKISKNT